MERLPPKLIVSLIFAHTRSHGASQNHRRKDLLIVFLVLLTFAVMELAKITNEKIASKLIGSLIFAHTRGHGANQYHRREDCLNTYRFSCLAHACSRGTNQNHRREDCRRTHAIIGDEQSGGVDHA